MLALVTLQCKLAYNVMLGLVATIVYIKQPIASLYGTPSIFVASFTIIGSSILQSLKLISSSVLIVLQICVQKRFKMLFIFDSN
jgi:hypothetical protein